MSKLFRPKTMRRMVVFLAMVAPAVYLFGSLFSALTGAHGQEVFAEPVYVDQYIAVDSYVDDGRSYKAVLSDNEKCQQFLYSLSGEWTTVYTDYVWNGNECNYYRYGYFTSAASRGFATSYYGTIGRYYPADSTYSIIVPLPWVFEFDTGSTILASLLAPYSDLSVLASVPSSEVPENAGAFSDYVFKNFFAKDNFLVQWGENAIGENPYGFAPFGYFWRYLDVNVLHLSNDQAGLMAYGYMYYASHVLLFDVGFILVTFFLTFIQKVADKIGGEDHA